MFLSLSELFRQFDLPVRGVVHAGAYHGEELPAYLEMGFSSVLLIEANPGAYRELQRTLAKVDRKGVRALGKAVSESSGQAVLHRTRQETQSSLLAPLEMEKVDEVAVECAPLPELIQEAGFSRDDFNLLVMDLQGAELLALRGASGWVRGLDAVLTEVNDLPRYQGCPLVGEIDRFLNDQGFVRRARSGPFPGCPAGDAFYVNLRSRPFPGL